MSTQLNLHGTIPSTFELSMEASAVVVTIHNCIRDLSI